MKEKIQKHINTKIIGNNIIEYETIPSTQKEARKLAEEKIQNGTMIITKEQTEGIGTHDRKWHTTKGKNMTLTLVIYPTCKMEELDNLTIEIAESMVSTIFQLCGKKLQIKKPNDIMYEGKKIGGILTQVITQGETIKYLLIGIGFNINEESFPKELEKIATSLKVAFKKEYQVEEIVAEFCNQLEDKIEKLLI